MIDEEYCPPNADMTIYMLKNEDHFSTIHERIIAGEKNLEPAPRAKGIALGLTLHCGPLETVRAAHEYTEEHVPATAKLITKPELLDPRSMQSDFYVLINKGQFQQDKKTSAKNIEVIMRVLNQQGVCQEECIYRGGGDNNGSSAFRSSVLYHSNNPIWRERICVRLAPEVFEKCHLFFTFWHASSTAKKTSVFAFTFMRLTDIQANGALVGDKEYNLQTWKSFSGMELTQADDDHSHKKPFYRNSNVSVLRYLNLSKQVGFAKLPNHQWVFTYGAGLGAVNQCSWIYLHRTLVMCRSGVSTFMPSCRKFRQQCMPLVPLV